MGTKIYLLDCGVNVGNMSTCLYNIGRDEEHISQKYSAFIDHPEAKIVVDTGLDTSFLNQTYTPSSMKNWVITQTDAQELPNALRAIGVKPEDIDIVINTHMHIDHCSYNRLFTKASWLIQQKEFLAAMKPEKWRSSYVREVILSGVEAGLRTEYLNGDYEVAKGVRVLSTPGHTEGHQSVSVETDNSGVFVLTGDACMVKEGFEGSARTSPEGWPPGAHDSLSESMKSIRRLRKYVNETKAATMKTCVPLYSHDATEFSKWKHAPNYYS